MAYPPSGYSLQDGGYFTDDGQGPYAWDGSTMVLLGSGGGGGKLTQQRAFSGAGTDVLVWVGPGRVMQVVVTSGAVGSIVLKDQIAAGTGPTLDTLTTTADPDTFLLNGGAGYGVYAGITLTITGANTGYIVMEVD